MKITLHQPIDVPDELVETIRHALAASNPRAREHAVANAQEAVQRFAREMRTVTDNFVAFDGARAFAVLLAAGREQG